MKLALHWKILIGLILGLGFGLLTIYTSEDQRITFKDAALEEAVLNDWEKNKAQAYPLLKAMMAKLQVTLPEKGDKVTVTANEKKDRWQISDGANTTTLIKEKEGYRVTLQTGITPGFVRDFVKPFGSMFISALKMVAVPLVLASLIIGVANLGDVSKLSQMGGKTIAIYLVTTVLATTVGLVMVNIIKPGKRLSPEIRKDLSAAYADKATSKQQKAGDVKKSGPLQPLQNMIPANVFKAAANNGQMLQVVFFALVVGVAALRVPEEKAKPLVAFFDSLNEIIIKIVEFIMMTAPYGVFALIASMIVGLYLKPCET